MGLLIYFGKVGASFFIHVDNNSLGIFAGLSALFWNTHSSPATSLWYIFVVFVYYLILPPLLWLFKGRMLPILLLALIIYFLPLPEYVYLDKTGHNFVFFMLGGMTTLSLDRYYRLIDGKKWLFIALFILSLSLSFIDMNWLVRMAIIGTLSLPAIHAIARTPAIMKNKYILLFGKYSYAIYLFNTIMIGLTKGIMLKFISWDGVNFLIFVPILFAAGLIGPILVKELIIKHIKPAYRLIS